MNCGRFTDAAAGHIAKCPQLKKVDFSFQKSLTDAAAEALAACPKLEQVNFKSCSRLTNGGGKNFRAFFENFANFWRSRSRLKF